jgi:hypothetical protein
MNSFSGMKHQCRRSKPDWDLDGRISNDAAFSMLCPGRDRGRQGAVDGTKAAN